jgi:hypothetical protein
MNLLFVNFGFIVKDGDKDEHNEDHDEHIKCFLFLKINYLILKTSNDMYNKFVH